MADEQEGVENTEEVTAPEQTPEEQEARQKLEEEARKYGWRPKEDFDRDPDNWIDADRFMDLPQTHVKMQRDEIKSLREKLNGYDGQLENIKRTAQQAAENARKQERERYESELEQVRRAQVQAAEEADSERFRQLQSREDQIRERMSAPQEAAPKIDPDVAKYRQENEWTQNPALWQEAVQAVNLMPNLSRATTQQQIEFAETTMRQKYPHMFKAAESAPSAAKVDGGGLGLGGRKAKGIRDLPPEARSAGEEFVAEGFFKSMDDYAKSYFEQEG